MKMKNLLWMMMSFVVLAAGCKKDKKATVATVTTAAATTITATGATVGGNVTADGGAPVNQRGICWATHANPTVGDSLKTSGAGTGTFTTTLTNLAANVTYYVKAYAINASGTAYGSEVTFTTAKGAPSVTTTAVTGIAPLTANSGGTVNSDGGATVTERGVVYGTTAAPTTANIKIVGGTGTGEFTSVLTPLASETKYYVRAYATNSFGTAYGQEISFTASSSESFSDIDGNVYSYIKIGSQYWMTSNLKVTHYRNGDPIINGLTGFDWATQKVGAYTFPNGDIANENDFGKLYNPYAIQDPRNIAPAGWHVPTDAEWKILEMNQGMSQADADLFGYRGNIAAKLKPGGSSGLNLQLYGGIQYNGSYAFFGIRGYFASATLFDDPDGLQSYGRSFFPTGNVNEPAIRRLPEYFCMSVICVKD